jgi:hypothetical protein
MIEFREDGLVFSFPEVHAEARCSIVFQRTLRLPDDSRRYPVPPGLGRFPLERVENHEGSVPEEWRGDGVFFPMYQSEALWVIFVGWYPFAIKVTVGGLNAVTGRRQHDERLWRPRDYVVFPRKPWMEWFCVGNGRARQFVAMPLGGDRRSAGNEEGGNPAGDIRITAHPMRAECYQEYKRRRSALLSEGDGVQSIWSGSSFGKGLFPRGAEHGNDFGYGSWELTEYSGCTAYPVNSVDFLSITGELPRSRPPTEAEYSEAGLPWLHQYGTDAIALNTKAALA